MSNDDPTCVNLQIDNADGSNQKNVIGTSRKLRCEIRNDNSDNDTEENIPEYRLISLAANPIMLSQIFNTCVGKVRICPLCFISYPSKLV